MSTTLRNLRSFSDTVGRSLQGAYGYKDVECAWDAAHEEVATMPIEDDLAKAFQHYCNTLARDGRGRLHSMEEMAISYGLLCSAGMTSTTVAHLVEKFIGQGECDARVQMASRSFRRQETLATGNTSIVKIGNNARRCLGLSERTNEEYAIASRRQWYTKCIAHLIGDRNANPIGFLAWKQQTYAQGTLSGPVPVKIGNHNVLVNKGAAALEECTILGIGAAREYQVSTATYLLMEMLKTEGNCAIVLNIE